MRYILKLMKENPRYYLDKIKYYPRGVVWELTLRCNMNCAHCGSEAGATRGNELNHEEALDLCSQLGKMGCERLTLLGGEPFLREDWDDLALSLYNYGVKVNVITNGYLMNQALIERIKKAKLTNVAISLDGGRAETHEKIRRKPGAFQRVLNGLSLLRQNDISPAMVTTITKDNLNELELILRIGIERKVDIWQIQIAFPRGNLCENRDFVIEVEDLPLIEQFVLQDRKDPRMRIDVADNVGYYSQNEEVLRKSVKGPRGFPFWTGCFAGIQVLGIEANGDIKGCLSLPTLPEFIEGNVRKESLADIWNKPGNFSYNRNFHTGLLEGDCADCEYNYVCRGGCKSSAYCFSGSAFNNPMCLYRLDKKRKGKLPDSPR